MATPIEQLIAAIGREYDLASHAASAPSASLTPLEDVFSESVNRALADIRDGYDSDDFPDLVVLNFIAAAHAEGYGPAQIGQFMRAALGA